MFKKLTAEQKEINQAKRQQTLSKIFSSKNVFYMMIVFTIICLIIGISLIALDHSTYEKFVSIQGQINKTTDAEAIKNLQKTLPNITMFIYGTFFMALSIILICFDALYGNSVYNKKMKTM